ncbi:MAG: hypothetical protein C0462_11285, partial [Alcanivorax sp.]|nr:hypothetical protein [Alcanivorax sp.]
GNGTISVLTDVVLKLIGVQPESGVLERQPDGRAVIRLRFNKAIDLHTPNLAAFNITSAGASVPHSVEIENNDALITLTQPHLLQPGDTLRVTVSDALVSVKPIQGQPPLVLHRLPADQVRDLVWRGKRHDALSVDSVLPRRVVAGETARLYVGVRGGSQDLDQVAMWLGSLPLTLQSVETSSDDARVMIYAVDTPALPAAGQYDLTVRVQRDGAADTAAAPGAVTVDAPLTIEHVSPAWGGVQGGATVVIRGSGFEPGNSVMEGLKVTFGSTPVQRIEVLAHDRLEVTAPMGAPGRVDVHLAHRNGSTVSSPGAYGYGMRQLVHTRPSRIYPTDIHIEQDSGVAIATAGYFPYDAPNIVRVAGVDVPDTYRLATFNVQRREQLPLVGGISSIPATGEAYARLARWLTAGALAPSLDCFLGWDCVEHRTPEQIALYERSVGTDYIASHDAVQLQPVMEREEGVMRRRVYVASGAAGIGRFNADDLNGMQLAGEQHYSDGTGLSSLRKMGDAVYATAFSLDPGEPGMECNGHSTGNQSEALALRQYGYQTPEDAVFLGELPVKSGYRLRQEHNELLIIGDIRHGRGRNAMCPWTMTSVTLAPGSDGDTVRIVDTLDPLLVHEHVFDDVVHDALLYGDYLIAAVGKSVRAVHRVRTEQRASIDFNALQESPGTALALRRYGNLLLVSSGSGIYALDIQDPLAMQVISAGNVERAEQVDVFRDRLVVASGREGLRALELPGSFVQASSVDEQDVIPADAPLVLSFNEAIDLSSLENGGLTLRDLTTGDVVPVSVTAEGEPDGDGVRAVRLAWQREPGHQYALSLTALSNLRAGGLWLPYAVNFALADAERQQPVIHTVEQGVRHRGDSNAIIVHGEGFSASAEVRINRMPVAFSRINDTQLQIPPGALEMLPLQNGMHAIVVEDGPLQTQAFGAIVLGEAPAGTHYTLTPDSADVQGGNLVRIIAGRDVILPGSRVLLRGRYTQREIESGDIQLHDDVVNLREFTFWLPGVEQPEVFGIYLRSGDNELFIGEFSYQMEKGRELVLPNYPPMEIGAAAHRDELMYVGVAGGTRPSSSNRFLMLAGIEIYDVTISDRPVRLSQLATEGAVTGLALAGDILWAAASAQGLLQVSVHDPKQPMIVREEAVPGYSVTDVAFDARRGWLAMSAATDLGTGIVRIIDTASDTLAPPQGVVPFAFVDGERAGRPVAVEWLGDQLFVLLVRGDQLRLATIEDVTDPGSVVLQDLDQIRVGDTRPGLLVQHGQLLVSGGGRLVTYAWEAGEWVPSYWSEVDEEGGVLAALDGSLMISGSTGLQNTRQPNLTLTGTRPAEGSTLGSGETVRLQFSDLINTDEVTPALSFTDAAGNDLSAFVQVEAINTLRGGYIDITANMPESSDFRITLNTALRSLDGRALLREVTLGYRYEASTPLRLSRAVNAASGRAFVHGDGTEQIVVTGSGFGDTSDGLVLQVGQTQLPASALTSVSDTRIEADLPALYLGQQALAVPVRVQRDGLSARLDGALVVVPKLEILNINPHTGPPQGGRWLELIGRGFHAGMTVTVGGRQAGNLELFSANRLRVRTPAGSFGYAPVAAESRFFDNDIALSPIDYFYAGGATGSAELPADRPSPVAAMAAGDQLLYAVTGGSYDVEDADGRRVKRLSSNIARLILVDTSDPVRPRILEREVAGEQHPYFHEVQGGLPDTNGFVDIARDGNNLYAVGGNRIWHFDLTVPADPLLINTVPLSEVTGGQSIDARMRAVVARNNLVFVSSSLGIHVLRRDEFGDLRILHHVDRLALGGTPDNLFLTDDTLWFTMEIGRRVAAIELLSGRYDLAADVPMVDAAGTRFRPRDLLLHGELLLVSSGERGSVVAYELDGQGGGQFAAERPLTYLLRNGSLTAGRMRLAGQTLHVAAGQGDLQLYDLSGWLAHEFNDAPPLRHYFAVTGDVNSLHITPRALYVGAAFPYADGQPTENPVQDGGRVNQLGGGISTIENDLLMVMGHRPEAGGYHPATQPLTIDFNRLLDPQQFAAGAPPVVEVLRGGAPVAGAVRHDVHDGGSRLRFTPTQPLLEDTRYTLRVAGGVRDLHGAVLAQDYRVRFVATGGVTPVFEALDLDNVSWRGGEEVSIFGSGFDENTVLMIGDMLITSDDFLLLTDNEIRIRLPALAGAPVNNRPVAIQVINGSLVTTEIGAITYITDPRITAVGAYDPASATLNPAQTRFAFGETRLVAVEGAGIADRTRLRVAGEPARDLQRTRHDRLVFRLPDNLIGPVLLELHNQSDRSDADTDDRLAMEFVSEAQLNAPRSVRHEELLLLGFAQGWSLYSTAGGGLPQLLSQVDLSAHLASGETISHLTLDHRHVLAVTSQQQLHVHSITNPLAPQPAVQWENPEGLSLAALRVHGNVLLSRQNNSFALGALSPLSLSVHPATGLRDAAMDAQGVLLLFADRIEYRTLAAPDEVAQSQTLLVMNPQRLQWRDGRVLVTGENEIELFDVARLRRGEPQAGLGIATLPGLRHAVLNGELLAAMMQRGTNNRALELYDVGPHGGNYVLSARYLATVRSGSTLGATDPQLRFRGTRLEWHGSNAVQAAEIVLDNLWQIGPRPIDAASQEVMARISGRQESWRDVGLAVTPTGSLDALSGFNLQVGDQLLFRVAGEAWQPGERYGVRLSGTPHTSVRGGQVNIDLPWSLEAAPLFGFEAAELVSLSPGSTITGRPVTLALNGYRLETVDTLRIGSAVFTRDDWTVSHDGTRIELDVVLDEAGLKTLVATLDNGEQRVLPASLIVTQALSVDSIMTAKTPADTVSDTQATTIVVDGDGLAGDIRVHLVRVDRQEPIGEANRKAFTRNASATQLTLSSTGGIPGERLQLVIVRAATDEVLSTDEAQWLHVVDDTPPTLELPGQPGYTTPMTLLANEAITVGGFQVIKVPLDYSGNPSVDISAQFELHQVSPERWQLRLLDGGALSHNAYYDFRMMEVMDTAGNKPEGRYFGSNRSLNRADPAFSQNVPAGEVRRRFVAQDTLPPRDITLTVISEGQRTVTPRPVNPGMALTRGRAYTLLLEAQDNYDENVSFQYRVSTRHPGLYTDNFKSTANSGELAQSILEDFVRYEVLAEARDSAGNVLRHSFEAGLRDPQIELDAFFTEPEEAEEAVRSTLHYRIVGDVDMLKTLSLKVTDQVSLPPMEALQGHLLSQDGRSLSGSRSFLNPKIRDVSPEDEGAQSITLPVYLDATFGFSGERRMPSAYTLYRDRTPPTLSIVSPQDGDFIAFDERADVLIKAFDRYGIEAVQVSRDGGDCEQGGIWTTLEDPRRYSFTVSADDFEDGEVPLVPISVRATDPNGNCSSEQITLRAYDPSEGAPEVVILSPRNGDVFYENEEVTFEVALRQVTSAQLCMDVGGEEADPQSCVPVSRTPDQDERRFVTLRLPQTGEDIVVIARIQSGSLRGYAFLNVLADQGMPQMPYVETAPVAQVFAGTGMQVRSGVPEGMTDFSATSYVRYRDPADDAGLTLPMADLSRWLPVSRDGDSVAVEAVLQDRAGNEAALTHTVSKLPFFASDDTLLWQAPTPGDRIQALVHTPHGLIWAAGTGDVTLWQAGTAGAEAFDALSSDTRLLSLQFSGTALYAEVEQQGGRFVRRYGMAADGWSTPQVQPLTGRMLAVQGDLLWQQLGDSVDAMVFSQGQAMPLAGVTFNEPLRQSSAWHDRLLVLTDSGLHVLAAVPAQIPRLEREALHGLEAAEGFAVHSDQLHVYAGNTVQRFRMLPDQGGLVLRDELTLPAPVRHLLADGAVTWAYVEGNAAGQSGHWWLLEDGEARGLLPQRDAPALTRLMPGQLVWVSSNEAGQATLMARSVDRELAAPVLSASVTAQASGLQINIDGLDTRHAQLRLHNAAGTPVPVYAIAPGRWQVPGWALADTAGLTATLVQHGREDSLTVTVPTSQGAALAVSPPGGSLLAGGAQVPLVLQLAPQAMAGDVQWLGETQSALPMAIWGDHAWHWLQLPGAGHSHTLSFRIDGAMSSPTPTLGTAERQGSDIGVTVLRPENNLSLMAGEAFPIRYSSHDGLGRAFRHAEVTLRDFDGVPLQTTRLVGEAGALQWHAPRVSQREVFTLRVRAYYGDDWSYNDAEIGLSVMPVRHLAAPVIQAPVAVRAGAHLTISLAEPVPMGQTTLEVIDVSDSVVGEAVLVRGDTRVALQVPPYSEGAPPLQIRARAEDGLGNHSEASRSLAVLPGYSVQPLGALQADHVLSDVDQVWLARDRDLLDSSGQLLRRFDGAITSLDRLGDRLLLSIAGQGFVIIDPLEQFSTVGTLPLAGQVSSVSLTGDLLFAIVGGRLHGFEISGNALTPQPLLDATLAQQLGQEGVQAVSLDT